MADVLRVCVVEDDVDLRQRVVEALDGFNVKLNHQNAEFTFNVETAFTSREYCNRKKSGFCPDFLILDRSALEIPVSEFLQQIARDCPVCYVLLMTTNNTETSRFVKTPSHRFDYLLKPFSADELRYAMNKACERALCVRQSNPAVVDEHWLMLHNILSMVAHELKAPLAAIEGYLQIIQDKTAGETPDLYRQMEERCLVRARGMRKLINNLLDLGSIQSGQRKRELVETDLVELAQNSMATLKPDADKAEICFNLIGPDSLKIVADRSEMEIVFNNLLSNAVKYNVPKGKVNITLEKANGYIGIFVSDSGIGIPKPDCERLFQKFVRVKNEKTRNIEGTGLGLCIVKRIVELYHGSVDVESVIDNGTTFSIRLPGI